MNCKTLVMAWMALGFSGMTAPGATVVYESFNYGGTNTAISGITATGTGLTGTYTTTSNTTGSSANYISTSLSFSSNFMPTQGGALQLSLSPNNAPTNETSSSGVLLNAGTQTGTIWGSYLFRLDAQGISGGSSADSLNTVLASNNTGSGGAANRRFTMAADSGNSGDNMAVSYASGTSSQTGTSGTLALAVDTTYLMLGRWTNVGDAGGGTATMWILTASAYDNWLANGATEAGLDTYATGRTERSEATQIDFNNSTYLVFSVGEGGIGGTGTLGGTFDEFRFGTDLASVAVAVPEPGTYALLALGLASIFVLRRKYKRTTPAPTRT